MIHIALHFVVPVAVALAFYGVRWRSAALLMLATLVVDVDHLLADPVYDPGRCSIGFHPLHTTPVIVAYALAFALPLLAPRHAQTGQMRPAARVVHLLGLGLLIHMALDGIDCGQ